LGIIRKKDEVTIVVGRENCKSEWITIEDSDCAIKMLKREEKLFIQPAHNSWGNEFVIDKVLNKYPVELAVVNLPIEAHEGLQNIQIRPGKS
jgi:hypothetical protein